MNFFKKLFRRWAWRDGRLWRRYVTPSPVGVAELGVIPEGHELLIRRRDRLVWDPRKEDPVIFNQIDTLISVLRRGYKAVEVPGEFKPMGYERQMAFSRSTVTVLADEEDDAPRH